jgi:ATP-binding cassette subfamily F protein 3
VVLRFPATKIPPPPLITLHRVRAGYGEHVVLDRLDLRIDPDDRIALLGANGNGKSTFARLLAGTLAPLGGELIAAPKLRVGYFAQHQIEELMPEESALRHLARRLPGEREERLRTRLGGFGLSQDKADLPAARLSGGEKARLTFALMSAQAPQILILDEPTNHLDVESRDALVGAINDFAGAVILISHDRHLIELTADRLWLVADGRVRPFDGDIDSYRRDLLGGARGNGANDSGKRSERQRGAEQRQRLGPLRQAAKEAERELERLSRDHGALAARLANAATYRLPGAELEALARRDAELKAAIAAAEARWLDAEQALEQAQG